MKVDVDRAIEKVVIDEETIYKRVKQLSKELNDYYDDVEEPVIFLGILKGSVMFMAELAKRINFEVNLEFMDVSSYEGAQSSGNIKIEKDIDTDVSGKEILIVEDVVDTGSTLKALREILLKRGAKEVKIITLLDKPEGRKTEVKVDRTGFKIPNEFVVGFGLDYNQKYRNLPYVGILRREIYEKKGE